MGKLWQLAIFFMSELQTVKNVFKLFHAISSKNALPWIAQIRV